MKTTARRAAVISATAVLGIAVLAGCSSSSSSSDSSTPSAEASAQMLPPVIINIDQTSAKAQVGDFIDILVSDNAIAGTTVSTDRPDLIELTQAHEDGSAIFNPGGKTLAPGTAVITVTNPDSTTRDITLIITE